MRYTVLICTHNRAGILPRSLEAVTQLRTPSGQTFDVLVVDNASSDATAQVVRDFAVHSSVPVHYLFEPRLGKAYALNSGIAASRSPFIAFTDDDACPHPDWLERISAVFQEDQADWVFGRVEPIWECPVPRWFGPAAYPCFAILDYGAVPFQVCQLEHSFYGVNLACRRPAVEALVGFCEDFGPNRGIMGEDDDIFARALAAGQRIFYAPDVIVGHIIPARRCQKAFHRSIIWRATEAFYAFLKNNPPNVPWLLGLPRYFHRMALGDLFSYLNAMVRRRRDESFHHELRLIRYFGWCYRAYRHLVRRHDPTIPVGAERPVVSPAHSR